jgi:hypothetical protein
MMVAFTTRNSRGKENAKDFEILWVCADCGLVSLFHSDLEDHKQKNNHHNVAEIDLGSGKLVAQYTQQND